MRLIRLTTVYPSYLRAFYRLHPELESAPYAEQYSRIVEDGFGWADFWTNALTPLGYDVWEVIANAEELQLSWAKESDASSGGCGGTDGWMYEVVHAQARWFRPDVVFIDDYAAFDAQFVRDLRLALPSVRLVLGWCAAPFVDESIFSEYDVVLTSIPGAADYFRRKGLRAEIIGHAFDPRILERIDTTRPKLFPFTFLGSIRPGAGHLLRRQKLLRELICRANLAVFAELSPISSSRGPGLRFIMDVLFGDRDTRGWRALASHINPAKYGLEMFQALRDSQVTLNAHSDFHGEWASNMRLYEATGVGTCLLTDWKHNFSSLFEPDKEVVVYRSTAECLEKARWLLEHAPERDAIARNGQLRTLRDHTFQSRAKVLDSVIRRCLRRAA